MGVKVMASPPSLSRKLEQVRRRQHVSVFYKIDKERRLVLSTGSGAFTLADALAHQQRLASDPDFDPSFSQLVDLTHVTSVKLTASDVRKLAQASLFSRGSRRAILATSEAAFGLARMFEALRESAGEDGIHVFRDLNDALDWLFAKGTSA